MHRPKTNQVKILNLKRRRYQANIILKSPTLLQSFFHILHQKVPQNWHYKAHHKRIVTYKLGNTCTSSTNSDISEAFRSSYQWRQPKQPRFLASFSILSTTTKYIITVCKPRNNFSTSSTYHDNSWLSSNQIALIFCKILNHNCTNFYNIDLHLLRLQTLWMPPTIQI